MEHEVAAWQLDMFGGPTADRGGSVKSLIRFPIRSFGARA